eukprot:4769135-Pyramimonas_sp.AAC.1
MLDIYLAFNLLRLKSEGRRRAGTALLHYAENSARQQRLPTRQGRASGLATGEFPRYSSAPACGFPR